MLDLNLYGMEDNTYPDHPSATRKIQAHTPLDSGKKGLHFPSLFFGDELEDGHADLLVQNGRSELYIFIGLRGPNLFARKPQKVVVNMPFEEFTQFVNLNRDGVDHLPMHNLSIAKPHRVPILNPHWPIT